MHQLLIATTMLCNVITMAYDKEHFSTSLSAELMSASVDLGRAFLHTWLTGCRFISLALAGATWLSSMWLLSCSRPT